VPTPQTEPDRAEQQHGFLEGYDFRLHRQERLVGVTHRHNVAEDLVTDPSVDPHVCIHVEAVVVIEDEILLREKMLVPSERRQRPWLMGDAMNP